MHSEMSTRGHNASDGTYTCAFRALHRVTVWLKTINVIILVRVRQTLLSAVVPAGEEMVLMSSDGTETLAYTTASVNDANDF